MTVEPKFHDWRDDSDHELNIEPVRKFNWKSLGAKKYWEPKIKHIQADILPEFTAEIVTDRDHPQNVAPIRLGENRAMEMASLVGKKGGVMISVEEEGEGPGSSLTGYPNIIDIGGENKKNVVIGRKPDEVSQFIQVATDADHSEENFQSASEYMGTPECGINAHVENFSHWRNDPIYGIACNSSSSKAKDEDPEIVHIEDPEPLLNTAWRYLGLSFIQHQPCSFECEKSLTIAQQNQHTLEDLGYGDEAKWLKEWLKLPFSWTAYHGLANIQNAYGIGSYTTDDYWDKKEIIWEKQHAPRPHFEQEHETAELEDIDPSSMSV